MSNDFVKDYFNKVKGNLDIINEQDAFFGSFADSVNNGDNVLFQKHLMETRIFDGTWVEYIEENLKYLDNIMRNPKSFIKDIEDIVPVERAKKTSAESIRYLASHSHHIKEVTNRGEVIPKKILTNYKEEDLGIYENRFIKTLTDKLVIFVEKRYNTIKELIGTDYINKFHNESKFHFDTLYIEYEMNLNIVKKINDNEAEKKNYQLLDRIEKLRSVIMSFLSSDLMVSLRGTRPIIPPVQRTNIIMKDPNYRKSYELWLFLDSYGKLDYTIDTSMSENTFNDDYLESLQSLTLLSFSTIVANDFSNMGEFHKIPNVNRKKKKPRILSNYDPDEEKENSVEMESHLINEYYYQQARKLYTRRIQDQMNDGQPFHAALQNIYQTAFKITESIFNDLIQIPDESKKDPMALLRYRIRNQKALDKIYQYKVRDLKKMEKEKVKNDRIIEKEKAKIEGKPIPLTEKQLLAQKEREKAKLLRQQEKEKERLAKLKEKEKEKALLAKEKAKEKERLLKQKAKEKEKERLAKLRTKEKERLAKIKEKAKPKPRKTTAPKVELTPMAITEEEVKLPDTSTLELPLLDSLAESDNK